MKLASALVERSDLQRKISELSNRLNTNAKVQDGEESAEKPEELLEELDSVMTRLEELVTKINLTNSSVVVEGKTLTEWLAKRDCLKQRIGLLRGFLNSASEKIDRYSRAEIKIVSTVNVKALQKDVDALSKTLRETDEKIQEINWTTELL